MSPLKVPVRLTTNRRKKDEQKKPKGIEQWIGVAAASLLCLLLVVVHFLYDLFIFVIRYVDAAIERHFGWGHPG